MPVMNIATMCTKHVAARILSVSARSPKGPAGSSGPPRENNARRTWLKDERARDLHIPAIARGLDALTGANERADDKSGGLAN